MALESANPNNPGDVSNFDDDSLQLLIEDGRRQLDDQSDRFKHVCDRALALLTISLAVIGLMATSYPHVLRPSGTRGDVALGLWSAGALFAVLGTLLTAAVAVARADFGAIDATVMSNLSPPIKARLAGEFAKAVMVGETTLAARVTLFRQAVRRVCWAAILLGVAYVVAAA